MRTKRVLLNLITDVLPMLLISLLGIFKFKLFVQVLGQEVQGMYQLFTQIMFYIAIVDGGLSSAVLHALYRPNTDENKAEMDAILSGAKRIFSFLGIIVYGIAFVVSFFVPYFIKDCPFDHKYVIITFLLFATSSVISYFFVPYQCLLEVKEHRYIYNSVYQIGQVMQSILEITMLLAGVDFFVILMMHSVIKLAVYSTVAIIAKKKFPEYNFRNKEKNYNFKHQVKHLMFHKINGLVGSNIDVLIVTRFLGLTATNVYSTYNYIINMMKQIIEKVYSSTLAILGNILSKDKTQAYYLFRELNSLMFFVATAVCVPLVLAIDPFIEIWYEKMIATDTLIAYAFCGVLFLAIVKIAITVFVNAAGLFEQTKKCAMTDTVVNLTLSLILVQIFGVSGVIFATCISVFIAEYIMKTVVIHKEIFGLSSKSYFINNLKFWLIAFIDLLAGNAIVSIMKLDSILIWFVSFAVFTTLNGAFLLFIYWMIKETVFMKRVMYLLKRKG
ncbi:MAG: hypothetical protein E7253_06075 [Lachnospiraceae bacterium]|nr:hypothetical protein [Lachnospiraceae bacterium]